MFTEGFAGENLVVSGAECVKAPEKPSRGQERGLEKGTRDGKIEGGQSGGKYGTKGQVLEPRPLQIRELNCE